MACLAFGELPDRDRGLADHPPQGQRNAERPLPRGDRAGPVLRVDRRPAPQTGRRQFSTAFHAAHPAQHLEPGEPTARGGHDRAGTDDRARLRRHRSGQGQGDLGEHGRRGQLGRPRRSAGSVRAKRRCTRELRQVSAVFDMADPGMDSVSQEAGHEAAADRADGRAGGDEPPGKSSGGSGSRTVCGSRLEIDVRSATRRGGESGHGLAARTCRSAQLALAASVASPAGGVDRRGVFLGTRARWLECAPARRVAGASPGREWCVHHRLRLPPNRTRHRSPPSRGGSGM